MIDVVVDLQFGSTGKGALSGYLSEHNGYDAVVSCNMPNAGHTAFSPDTQQCFIHKVLPSGIFGKRLKFVGVGPGSAFFIDRLEEEWKNVCAYRNDLVLLIHDAAAVATQDHKDMEAASLSRISSTMQGSAEALISKIRRQEGATAKYHSREIVRRLGVYGDVEVVTNARWIRMLTLNSNNVLLEGSQGYSLGISAGFYPYCTSRDCTVARVIADCGLPGKELGMVYGSARVHPIRVGNTPDGHSGDWYPDQVETDFETLGVKPERTTVTQRIRRVASFSAMQIKEAMSINMPDVVFLNFWQYDQMASEAAAVAISRAADELGCGRVRLIGTGPLPSDIKEV